MKLIVGLGNPGKKYEMTRHNIGFIVLDYMAMKYKTPISKVKYKSYFCEIRVGNEKVILLKPQTYMNLSGEAVLSAVNYYGIELENVMVVHDDIDVEFGKIRIRKQGSGGTHNGMKNILFHLQSDKFPRLRFGVGKAIDRALVDYVLERFPKEDWDELREVVVKAEEAIEEFILNGIDASMNKYNG
ncbi:MAG: aminoacyl-tRNA hydrolase [Clostridiales bacterium]|nr:aminoacyl-tRNA hydrolase [Clostridiales bacterium]